jgi:hypothetical protein
MTLPAGITPDMIGAMTRCIYYAQNWLDHCTANGRQVGDHADDPERAKRAVAILLTLLPPEP